MGKMDIYNRSREVPKAAQKPIKGGRTSGFTDINPMWRIQRLTEEFGPCGVGWKIEQTARWTETVGDEIAAFVEINLYIKVDGEWSAPIFGTGGSRMATKEKGGVYVSDECYKMALTDAISVSCKMLGIGADIYWEEGQTKYSTESEDKDDNGKEKSASAQKSTPSKTEPAEQKASETKKPTPTSHSQNNQPDPAAPATEEMLIMLSSEVERTCFNLDKLLESNGMKDIREIRVVDCRKLINLLKKYPTKKQTPPPSMDIPDEELPFN